MFLVEIDSNSEKEKKGMFSSKQIWLDTPTEWSDCTESNLIIYSQLKAAYAFVLYCCYNDEGSSCFARKAAINCRQVILNCF